MNRIQKRRKNIQVKKYGLNVNQYLRMLEEQNNVCYICQQTEERGLSVDHCHTTNNVRGLLCSSCNNGLGRFKDNIEYLQKAIEYLQRDYIPPAAPKFDEYLPSSAKASGHISVKTPKGKYNSISEAARDYNVHNTTIMSWCGRLKGREHLKKIGFEYE